MIDTAKKFNLIYLNFTLLHVFFIIFTTQTPTNVRGGAKYVIII